MTSLTVSAQKLLDVPRYYSASKLVEIINKTKLAENIKNIRLYYQGSQTFKSKYGDMCIKPIYLIIFTNDKPIYVRHEKLLDLFEGQPIIYVKLNAKRHIPQDYERQNMFYLTIEFKQMSSQSGYTFYPMKINVETNEKVVDKIKVLAIKSEVIVDEDFL